jgi:glycosyltransferase involved in cell wall biosynthesis
MVGTTINLCEDEAVYARKVIGIQASKQRVIANAVDLNVFRPGTTEEKQNWRKQHGLPLDALVLGTVGRYSRQKDPFTLYRALAPILQREAQVWFAHLGEGELFEPTRVLWRELGIENKVISIRYDSAPAGFYRGLDAFVLSSRYEGLALSAIEAVASDLPLILSDVPGNREFQRIGLSHVAAVPVGDAVALTHAIGLWLEDRKTPRPTNHRAVAEACFSREHCYGRVLAEYQAAVARHASCA